MARFNFRQGIARFQEDGFGGPAFLQPTNGGSYIDLLVTPDPTIFLIAHFDADYMITENASVVKAWGPFTAGTDYWLYWDIDFITGALSRGHTTRQPVAQSSPPPPAVDQHWFDTAQKVMKVWTGSSWIEKVRCFAAKYQNGATIVYYPTGSQVGLSNTQTFAGAILYDPDGTPLQKFNRNRRGQFITTETALHSQFSRISNFRMEAAIVQGEAQEHIPIHHAIAYSGYSQLVLARSSVSSYPAIGIAMEEMNTGEVRSFITRGFVTNDVDWNWSGHPAGTPLFVGPTGELVADPPISGFVQKIAIVVDVHTIFVNVREPLQLSGVSANLVPIQMDRYTGQLFADSAYTTGGGGGATTLNELNDVNAATPADGDVLVYRTGSPTGWTNEPATGTDEFVKASSNDTTPGHLNTKIVAGAGISFSTLNPSGNEQLEVALNASLDQLNDVNVGGTVPAGYVLGYSGAGWVPTAPPVASSSAGLFVTGVSSPGSGIVSDFVYAPGTVPANVVVLEATSDQEIVRIEFIVEGGGSFYSPTVVVDVPTGSPAIGSNVVATLTQDPQDIRTFHGYADIAIADGLEAGRVVYLEASTGATTSVLIKRAPIPPEILTMSFNGVYPSVAADPTAGYPGGTQTTIKFGDLFYVSGTVENSATVVSLNVGGAVGSGTFTTATAGGSLGANDSGGVGYKTFTIRFTASSASGAQTASAFAQNSFGSAGTSSTTTNVVIMDQVAPSVSIGSVTYPAGQQALKNSEAATVSNTVSGQDYVYYYENGGAGYILISNPTTYQASKTVTRVGGSYLYNGNNFAIKAFKTSNGTTTTVATGDVNISNVAPTVGITGASSRLISSPTGLNYIITLTFTQRLLQAPTIVSSGDPTAGTRGVWSGSGTSWFFTLNVDDADVKGTYNWTVNAVKTLSNNTYNGVTITAGGSYTIGGFTTRTLTVGALEQVVDLGVDITDPTKVTVRYAGTTDNLTYRGSNLTQFVKGWSAVDGNQLVYTAGAEPFQNYSNFVYQNPTLTPTNWLFLTDAAFAGANTTGTLQIEIWETA